MDQAWIDIIERQPLQHQRVLVKIIGGLVRLTNYDRFCYEHWSIQYWKPVPENNGQKSI